jgi:hypothetical protein
LGQPFFEGGDIFLEIKEMKKKIINQDPEKFPEQTK